jgi:hypothetical protein
VPPPTRSSSAASRKRGPRNESSVGGTDSGNGVGSRGGSLYAGGGGGPADWPRPSSPFGAGSARRAADHLAPVYQRHVAQSGRFPAFIASAAHQATMDGDLSGWAHHARCRAALALQQSGSLGSAPSSPPTAASVVRSSSRGRDERDLGSRGTESPDTLAGILRDDRVSLADYSTGKGFQGFDLPSPSSSPLSRPVASPAGLPPRLPPGLPPGLPSGLPPGLVLHGSYRNHRPGSSDGGRQGPMAGVLTCAALPVAVGATEAELRGLTAAERRQRLNPTRASPHASPAATHGGGGGGPGVGATAAAPAPVPKPRRLHRPVALTEAFKRGLIAAVTREAQLLKSRGGSRVNSRGGIRPTSPSQQAAAGKEEGDEEGRSPLMSASFSGGDFSLLRL